MYGYARMAWKYSKVLEALLDVCVTIVEYDWEGSTGQVCRWQWEITTNKSSTTDHKHDDNWDGAEANVQWLDWASDRWKLYVGGWHLSHPTLPPKLQTSQERQPVQLAVSDYPTDMISLTRESYYRQAPSLSIIPPWTPLYVLLHPKAPCSGSATGGLGPAHGLSEIPRSLESSSGGIYLSAGRYLGSVAGPGFLVVIGDRVARGLIDRVSSSIWDTSLLSVSKALGGVETLYRVIWYAYKQRDDKVLGSWNYAMSSLFVLSLTRFLQQPRLSHRNHNNDCVYSWPT